MAFGDERQVRSASARTYRHAIENGPPDIETLDRRRVDPPAGCRAATEPAIVAKRRSVDDDPSHDPAIHLHGWPVCRFAWQPRLASGGAALIPKEPFDIGDEVATGRESLLVVHRLEPFDVVARRLILAGREIQPPPELARLVGQLVGRDLHAEMGRHGPKQLQGRCRIWSRDVMRDLRE